MKKRILLIVSIFVVVLILFSSSYALLFKSNQTDKQEYTTGMLEITSETLSGSVTLNNPLPMSDSDGENTTPYVFRITNTGNLTYKFNIMLLSTTTNNQISSNFIKLKVNNESITTLNSLTDGVILSNITLKPGKSIDVTLKVWLSENTPNTEIGKTFNAKITTEGEAIYTNKNYAKETLTNLGLTVSSGTPDFSKTSCSDGCDESTVGIYETEDDIGTSYYFRGDVENNYVYFANKYWRIIRINGDGTVRMIYAGTSAHPNGYDDSSTNDMIIGKIRFNSSYYDNAYVGYMYGTTGSSTYSLTHSNTNDSTIKDAIDNWYNTNIKNTEYEQYVVDTIYCNDREPSSGTGIGTSVTDYKAKDRLLTNKTPSLKCTQVNDRFTIKTTLYGIEGNGALTNPIALITADEVAYAGGAWSTNNSKYYLYTKYYFWTMSPFYFDASFAYGLSVSSTSRLDYPRVNTTEVGVRPVISISGTALNAGTGTKNDPFKIDAAKNTLTQLELTESVGTPDFSKTSCSSGCEEATVGLYKTEDDFGDAYYFRGDVENNYVYFANKYWRIIRINGDGSIRMIYAGTSAHDNGYNDSSTTDMRIGTSAFNSSHNDNAYVGYMYGTTGSSTYSLTHSNTNNSTIKATIDNWYNTNIKNTNYEQYVVDTIYCNDRELDSGTGIGTTSSNYKAYNRNVTNKTPSLKCNQVNNRFTVSLAVDGVQGNGALTNPIGLITADEIAYAGGKFSTGNSKYYLYTGYFYWSMSPDFFGGVYAYEFRVSDNGNLDNSVVNFNDCGVRPVISISGTALSSGTGTKANPFKIG